jgi:hypothetical protein
MVGYRFLWACIVSSLISGCATLPSYRDDAVSTADIIRHIKCELRDAAWSHPGNEWVRTWKAGLVLSLEVFHSGGIGSDNTWVFPMNQGATFILGVVGGFSGQATRTERISFNESLRLLNSDPKLLCRNEDPDMYARLGGELGIADLLKRVGRTKEVANINPTAMDYNLDFVIKKNGGLAPKFSLLPIGKEKTFTGTLAWTGSYSDTQTLKLTLVPPAEREAAPACARELVDGKCPLPVYIVAEPKAGPRALREEGAPGARRGVSRDVSPGITPADEGRIERGQSRNLLQGIDDQLRRDRIGQ